MAVDGRTSSKLSRYDGIKGDTRDMSQALHLEDLKFVRVFEQSSGF